ncbi:MAG: hypothetical protein WCR27_09160 [Eubacteriales bacterium]
MNKLNYILLLTTLYLFVACEYEPNGENVVELNPPENTIPIKISLNDVNPSDSIYIYTNTSFSINIDVAKKLLQAVVLLDGQEYKLMSDKSLNFIINPDELSEGIHRMTVKAAFSSGTKSLAEMMGLETYQGDLSWNLRVIHNPREHFKIKGHINQEGFFELNWEHNLPESLIDKFTIQTVGNKKIIIDDVTNKSFVDYEYACGYAYYDFTMYLKDGNAFEKTFSLDTPKPNLYIENLDMNNLRIYWDKCFANFQYQITDGSTMTVSGINDTTITVPQIFGRERYFTLTIKAQKGEDRYSLSNHSVSKFYAQGTSLNLDGGSLYAYNKTDNIIYTSDYDTLVAFNANTLQEVKRLVIKNQISYFSFGGKIATAPHNSTIAAMTGKETWIFKDSHLINPIIIPQVGGNEQTSLASITSNDNFFWVKFATNICQVFNLLTGDKIYEFPFTYTTKKIFRDFISVSEDGRFFCASSENGIEIFGITENKPQLIYTDTREYKGAIFVPSQPNKLLLAVGSDIEIRQIPNFNLIDKLDVSAHEVTLCNIDPTNMNLLYFQNDSLKVCGINNLSKTVFKIKSDQITCRLLNNKIFTYMYPGMYWDITPYLNKQTIKY